MPGWLRWLIALPGVAIGAAILDRQLEHAGFDDVSSGIVFPSAVALVILGAGQIAAHIAPFYKKQVGLAIVFAELSAFCLTFLGTITFGRQVPPYPTFPTYPASIVFLNSVIPLMGVVAAIVSLGASKSPTDEPRRIFNLPGADLGLRRGLGIAIALGASAAFESIVLGFSAAYNSYLPTAHANALAAVIDTGIIVTLVVVYEPVKKTVATWVVAGIFLIASVAGIGVIASFLIRYGKLFMGNAALDLLVLPSLYYAAILTAGTIVGTILGLQATASIRSDSRSTSR